jgi:transcriptional regulator with XRE-family HTH domain
MQKSIHSSAYKHFLQELRRARLEAGLTQEQLALALDEDQTLVSKVERGVRRMDVVELHQWVAALGLPLLAFVERLDDRLTRNQPPTPSRKRRQTLR